MQTQTSLEAFESIKKKLGEKQERVLDAIQNYNARFQDGVTDYDLAQMLNWPINCVTPRRGELEQMGLIYVFGTARNPTGRRAHCYKAF